MVNNNFAIVLESYTIPEDPTLIALEVFFSSVLESDMSSANDLKTKLTKLANARVNNDEEEMTKIKEDIDKSIEEIKQDANNEADIKKKEKLKNIAKNGAIIAGSIIIATKLAKEVLYYMAALIARKPGESPATLRASVLEHKARRIREKSQK